MPAVEVEVAREIAESADAVGLGGEADQLLHGLMGRGDRCVKRDLGDDALSEVVEALEAAAAGNGHEAGVVQMFQRGLAVSGAPPTPPRAGSFAGVGEVRGGERSALGNLGVDGGHVGATVGPHVVAGRLRVLVHAIANEGIEGDGKEAGGVSPVFEELAFAVGQGVEGFGGIGTEAGECGDVVCADEDTDRVDLEGVDPGSQFAEVGKGGRRQFRAEPLGRDGQAASVGQREGDRHSGPPLCAKYPFTSITTWLSCETRTLMAPPEPTGTIAALAVGTPL